GGILGNADVIPAEPDRGDLLAGAAQRAGGHVARGRGRGRPPPPPRGGAPVPPRGGGGGPPPLGPLPPPWPPHRPPARARLPPRPAVSMHCQGSRGEVRSRAPRGVHGSVSAAELPDVQLSVAHATPSTREGGAGVTVAQERCDIPGGWPQGPVPVGAKPPSSV